MTNNFQWHRFCKQFGQGQKLPPERRPVLVQVDIDHDSLPNPIMLGYLRYAAGDKECPYFVTPGGHYNGQPFRWADCLPDLDVYDFFKSEVVQQSDINRTEDNG